MPHKTLVPRAWLYGDLFVVGSEEADTQSPKPIANVGKALIQAEAEISISWVAADFGPEE